MFFDYYYAFIIIIKFHVDKYSYLLSENGSTLTKLIFASFVKSEFSLLDILFSSALDKYLFLSMLVCIESGF